VFSARPGTIKNILDVNEPHPRNPNFVTSEKFAKLRNELYALLHDEIRKAMAEAGIERKIPGAARGAGGAA
jgi:NitT/TauT family transport system ATP-binding protein